MYDRAPMQSRPRFRSTWLRVPAAGLLFAANTLLHVPPLLVVALVKALLPLRWVRNACNPLLTGISASWIGLNTAMIGLLTHTHYSVTSDANLRGDGHYLVLANHQSWVDIPVLQALFNRKIPLLRFFLKQQLFWVPLLGLAWWALDFPFMKRYSREELARRPELAGRDIEATQRACAKFRHIPVSIMNFAEGTRYTTAKHAAQASPFPHLLNPRAGGIAFVLNAMGEALHSILDVTLVYPNGRPTLVDLFADRVGEVRVHIRELSIPAELRGGDYQNDPEFRARAQRWINGLWSEKEAIFRHLLEGSQVTSAG
jgi:1-acyl-sn-glycerol-3-phosphate acyltransferase